MQQGPGVQKILPEMHEMTLRKKQMLKVRARRSLSIHKVVQHMSTGICFINNRSNLCNMIWMRRCKHYKNGKTTIARKLEEKLKKANEDKTLAARNATRQALQLVQQPVPFDKREYTRVTHYAHKDLFQTFKFFMTEEEVLDFSMKGSAGEMTMAYFNIVPEKQMQWWNQYRSAIKEGITYSRHATQTLIGKDLKSKFT